MPATYGTVHYNLLADRGRAKNYDCKCGKRALEWAYLYNGEPELVSAEGYRYAEDINKCYEPMCRSCHVLLDLKRDEKYKQSLINNFGKVDMEARGKIRRTCDECGLESTPAGIGTHQKRSGHSGHKTH